MAEAWLAGLDFPLRWEISRRFKPYGSAERDEAFVRRIETLARASASRPASTDEWIVQNEPVVMHAIRTLVMLAVAAR
jgi:hypothetical protein